MRTLDGTYVLTHTSGPVVGSDSTAVNTTKIPDLTGGVERKDRNIDGRETRCVQGVVCKARKGPRVTCPWSLTGFQLPDPCSLRAEHRVHLCLRPFTWRVS